MGNEVDWGSFFSWSPKNYTTLAAQWLVSLPFLYFPTPQVTYLIATFAVVALPVQIMRIRGNKAAAMQEQADPKENA